jgi:DNA-directed RNA polymerase subunit H (RpoH/RPB5)
MVNISHHSDVPKHEIMTSEEAKALLSGLKLKINFNHLQNGSSYGDIGARPAM